MKPKPKLYIRLLDLHDKHGDLEILRCAIQAAEMESALKVKWFDRAYEYALVLAVIACVLKMFKLWL